MLLVAGCGDKELSPCGERRRDINLGLKMGSSIDQNRKPEKPYLPLNAAAIRTEDDGSF